MTNNLRVIQHAWHFCHALVFGVEVLCDGIGQCVLHTLIGRYSFGVKSGIQSIRRTISQYRG
ncbi:DUF3265 domain-containing protein [Vibrio parahaemolyticus]|nr:DUF3265 domain-containing protein [Vibrio parahaemolyticus]